MFEVRCPLLLSCLTAVTGCATPPAGAPSATPAPVQVQPQPSPESELEAAPRVQAIPEVISPQPPDQIACTFGPAQGHLIKPVHFLIGGSRFASIDGLVKLRRLLLADGGQRAWAELETRWVQLSAEVDPKSLRFALSPSSDPVDGWLELRSASVKNASNGQVTVDFELPSRLTPTTPRSSLQSACTELTFLTTDQPSSFGDTELRPGTRTPLTKTPRGDVIGHIETPKRPPRVNTRGNVARIFDPPNITKLEEKAGHIRIRLVGGSSAVIGWIPNNALDSPTRSVGIIGLLSSARASEPSFTCSRDVDLIVDYEGAPVQVGLVRANAVALGERRADGTIRVNLKRADVFAGVFRNAQREEPWVDPYVTAEDAQSCEPE